MNYQTYYNYLDTINESSACTAKKYIPIPSKLWNRTESVCKIVNDPNSDTIFVPYLNKNIPTNEVAHVIKMFRKGNVLQYPSNRTGITNQTKFSNIVKGNWVQRKKSWSSQTSEITMPNVNKLYRNNAVIISNNKSGDIIFPECPKQQPNVFFPPKTFTPSAPINFPPEPLPPKPATTIAFPISSQPPTSNISSIVGGNLITCTTENICNGTVETQKSEIVCYPTSDSDVPGKIINLCYPNNIPVTIPRERRKYVQSTFWPIKDAKPALNTNAIITV